jgi:hypothetical protein
MAVVALIIAGIAALANVVKTLPELGINIRIFGRTLVPLENTPRRHKAWGSIFVSLASLVLCAGAFYYFFHPRVVEKIVEKPIEKIVEKIVPAQCPSPQKPDKVKSTKPTALATPTPPVQQDCGGGNCAVSVGQQGGITGGQITIGAKTWDMVMTGEKQKAMISVLQAVHGSIRVEWLTFDPDSLKISGGILYTFIHAGWAENDRPNAAGSMCTPSQEWDCHGFSVSVRDRNSDLAKTALQALSMLKEPMQVTELPKDLPDDLVVVFAQKP